MERMLWKGKEEWKEICPENTCKYSLGWGKKRKDDSWTSKNDPIKLYRLDGQKLIALIRELKVIKDELGEVNRKTLGIEFGINSTSEKTIYNPADIWRVPRYIHRIHSKIAGRDMLKELWWMDSEKLTELYHKNTLFFINTKIKLSKISKK